jgi:hypothetical protein
MAAKPRHLAILMALTCIACNATTDTNGSGSHKIALDTPTTLKEQLAFTCAYEKDHIPPLDPDADKLLLTFPKQGN